HAEVARGALFGVAALLVTDDHARGAVKARQAAHDGLVVGVHAVAVQLVEIGEYFTHVVERVRPLRVARHQGRLPGGELAVDFLGQRLAFLLQAADLVGDIHRRIGLYIAQLLDLVFKLGQRLFEFKECIAHEVWFRYWAPSVQFRTGFDSRLRHKYQVATVRQGCHADETSRASKRETGSPLK